MCTHTRLRLHVNPPPLQFFPLSPPASLCRIQKLNEILRSDFLLPLLLPFDTSGGLSIGVHSGFNPHQFRSSLFLTMVISRHLSTFSLQTPPSTKMSLLLWLCIAQTPMPMPAPRQQRALRGSLQINTFHPLPPQRQQFLSTARLRSLGFHIPRPAILLQARRNLITQKNENLKSADTFLPTMQLMGRARSLR